MNQFPVIELIPLFCAEGGSINYSAQILEKFSDKIIILNKEMVELHLQP
ncbi:MAG: hypothetical protein JHC41_05240 [Nitrosopumilus sp.]|nr:hypothetical protein [Nitrosopumilus sp.]